MIYTFYDVVTYDNDNWLIIKIDIFNKRLKISKIINQINKLWKNNYTHKIINEQFGSYNNNGNNFLKWLL